MLEQVFGESGAVVAQFFVILIFVLVLTAVCYWLFRYYYGTAFASGGRSRVPRLGIVDSVPIDYRHRLVLVRRDNVEHLLLIGKSADLVVESSIIRAVPAGARQRPGQAPPRQSSQQAARPQQTEAAPAAPQQTAVPAPQPTTSVNPSQQMAARSPSRPPTPSAAPTRPTAPASAAQRRQTTGISEPIPFPQNRRSQPARPAAQAATTAPVAEPPAGDRATDEAAQQRGNPRELSAAAAAPLPVAAAGGTAAASASGHFEEPAHPTRVESAFPRAEAHDANADKPIAAPGAPPTVRSEPNTGANPAANPGAENAPGAEISDRPDEAAETPDAGTASVTADTDAEQSAGAETEDDRDTAATVSNLEEEMARLLGEITSRRDG